MSDLLSADTSVLKLKKLYPVGILKSVLTWLIKLFAVLCMLVGFVMIFGFFFMLWLDDPEIDMTGIGSCGSPKCTEQ
jgi:preprotein translocase subunit SecY